MKVNYHTHTPRCHHAVGDEEEYILTAIKCGFDELGFADHTPWDYGHDFYSPAKMDKSELHGYVEKLKELREKYKDQLPIYIGLECEYFPELMDWLKKTIQEEGLDYIILGQHYHGRDDVDPTYNGYPTDDPQRFLNYVQDLKDAMDTGLYSYIAHPDLINYDVTTDLYKTHMREICEKAKAMNMVLEFNMLGFKEGRNYPQPVFWQIASEVGNDVIIGFDAHNPNRLDDDALYQKAVDYLKSLNLNIVQKLDRRW